MPQNLSDEELILAPGEESEDLKYEALELQFERSGAAGDIVYAELVIRNFIPDDVLFDYIFRLNTATGDREQKLKLNLHDKDCGLNSSSEPVGGGEDENLASTSKEIPKDEEYVSTVTKKTQEEGKGDQAWTVPVWILVVILSVLVVVFVAVVIVLVYKKALFAFIFTRYGQDASGPPRPEAESFIQKKNLSRSLSMF